VAQRFETDASFKRRLKKKPPEQQAAVLECIARLIEDPHHPGLHTKRLQHGSQPIFYARIDRANRVTFHWREGTMVFRNHCHKTDVLRRP
jgi:hypothetical protein